MAVPAYEVREVTKVYRGAATAANDRISLDIERGTVFAVLGPNGAGKTTLVRQLTGLLRPTSGSIRLFGEDIEARPQVIPNAVAYFGQRVLALHAHRFEEVLRITGMLRGQSPRQARVQAQALMERFEAAGLSRTLLVRLSGGERRLAALLAAFMGDRRLLVLDEPTSDLDPLRPPTLGVPARAQQPGRNDHRRGESQPARGGDGRPAGDPHRPGARRGFGDTRRPEESRGRRGPHRTQAAARGTRYRGHPLGGARRPESAPRALGHRDSPGEGS